MSLEVFDRLESEVRSYVRSFPTVFARARDAILTDEAGRDYVDFFSGAGTLNYGHNNPELKKQLIAYLHEDGVAHGLDMATSAKKAFLEAFERVILGPRGLLYKVQFPGPTGTNAVEAALKLARQVKGRSGVISFTNGFHGVSGGALAATGNAKFRDAAGIALGNTTFMPYDGYLGAGVDTTEYLERMIADRSSGVDHPAAVIVETVQGEGGVNVARFEWLRALERVCRRHDMLMIVDDIQVGCGRTGTFFSFEGAGISPDIVTLSKSISGFGLPMSLVLMKPELDVWAPGTHSGTFRGNNLAFVTARAALERYWETPQFEESLRRKAGIVSASLAHMARAYPRGGFSVRGRGLIQGLASNDAALPDRVSARAFREGLIIETSGAESQVLKLLPPLTIDELTLRRGLEILERAIAHELGSPVVAAEPRKVLRMAGVQ
ncbi:MAG TPA: diaminobutyrate--2-oxoglutarate transaminase [Burkholderiales bacterium]|nr:diaminobutyrate--2-oxoglutarate transaminase [Burkholderiales bacterium]